MPVVAFQFGTFNSNATGGGVQWTNPGFAGAPDGMNFATAALNAGNPSTELLVCTGASVSLPTGSVVTAIKVKIKGKFGGGVAQAEIHEIWPWEGSGGGSIPSTSRNQAGSYSMSDGTGLIGLTTTNTVESRGANNWKWWWLERLTNGANGVGIRARRVSGSPTIQIDHVELELTYEQLFQKWPPVDYRAIAYDVLAGISGSTAENEDEDQYKPITRDGDAWHDESIDCLNTVIDQRSAIGLNRIVFGMPAGRIAGQDACSHQWEPMFDDQRTALMAVIPAWLKGDPEREAILYLGTKIDDPDDLDMANAHEPDVVGSPADVEKLKRTLFPYRDCVGIRRFLFDASSKIDRTKAIALFQWGRDNGMEFVMEAIPHNEDTGILDETVVEDWSAYALTAFIIGDDDDPDGRDENMEWDFTKGRLFVQVRSGDHATELGTEAGRRAFFQRFAREGYVLKPRDAALDTAARAITSEHIGRGVSYPVGGSATRGVANSVTRFVEGVRTRD